MAITTLSPTYLGLSALPAAEQVLATGGYEQVANAVKITYAVTLDGSATTATLNFIDGTNGLFAPPGNPVFSIASVTESSTTVTVTLQQSTLPSWLVTNAIVSLSGIQGTSASGYNLSNVLVTGTSSNTFTYTAASGLTSPATANTGLVTGIAQIPSVVQLGTYGGTQQSASVVQANVTAITATGFSIKISGAGTNANTLFLIAVVYR